MRKWISIHQNIRFNGNLGQPWWKCTVRAGALMRKPLAHEKSYGQTNKGTDGTRDGRTDLKTRVPITELDMFFFQTKNKGQNDNVITAISKPRFTLNLPLSNGMPPPVLPMSLHPNHSF